MRDRFIWADISYTLMNGKEVVKDLNHTSCFTYIRDKCYNKTITHMIMKDLDCALTKEYTTKYLQYVGDMLALEDVEIIDDTIKFKFYKCINRNMLVGSVLRFLIEPILGNAFITNDEQVNFIKNVVEGECKYDDKLERFCYFYSRIVSRSTYGNGHAGHSWRIEETKIRSTQYWLDTVLETKEPVNNFFTH